MDLTPPFGLGFSNIPLINLREEFHEFHKFIGSPEAAEGIAPGRPRQPIETPLLTWYGMPDDLMTLLLQRSILGVEAYLPAALFFLAAERGSASTTLAQQLREPFKLGAKVQAANVFDRMPSLVAPELSLRAVNPTFYEQNVVFYKTVRNPLFHGKHFSNPHIEGLRAAFAHIAQLYKWIDAWHDPRKWIKSSIQMGPLTINMPVTFVDDAT